ncbi:hypothetical protein HJD18_00535 [Thermoleophilia bacterium SCSIO 60948]|nr:hypothetical protein HJD18_00535 [Thermoleophilia bacterium SCSIO 60948]
MKVWSLIWAAITAVLALVAVAIDPEPSSRTAVTSTPPDTAICDFVRQPDGTLPSRRRPVSIPSRGGEGEMQGLVLAPKPPERFEGERPVIVIAQDTGGDRCDLVWLGRWLAGRGYIVVSYSSPSDVATPASRQIDRLGEAIDFAAGPQNPFRRAADQSEIGLLGFSYGARLASIAQADEERDIEAVVALDNLHRWRSGDPGAVRSGCAGEPRGDIEPRAPALGMASDSICRKHPEAAGTGLKQPGLLRWREVGEPSMELVLADFSHRDFGTGGTRYQRALISYFASAWFDRWLLGRRGAEADLLADEVLGQPVGDLLSTEFDSGVYLPDRIDDLDYAATRRSALSDADRAP